MRWPDLGQYHRTNSPEYLYVGLLSQTAPDLNMNHCVQPLVKQQIWKPKSWITSCVRLPSCLPGQKLTSSLSKNVSGKINILIILEGIFVIRKRQFHFFSSDLEVANSDEANRKDKFESFQDFLVKSGLSLSLQELLSEYLLLEDYYMSR